MASIFTLKSQSYDGRYMYVTCKQTPDIGSNTSKIDWTLTVTGGSVNYYSTGPTAVTINGTQVYYKARTSYKTETFPAAKGSKSGSLTVAHTTDGTKTISISIATAFYNTTVKTSNGTWELDPIPRQATLTAAPNFNDEENPTVTFSNPAGAAADSLAVCITLDGNTAAIPYRELSSAETSYTIELTEAERELLRNATPASNTLQVGFCLRTTIGDEEYFSKVWKTLTIVNADPVLNPTITDSNEDMVNLTGGAALVRYYSNASFTTGAAAQKGATIVSQTVTCGGVSISAESGSFDAVQSGSFAFSVVDSRGNTTTLTLDKPFVEYLKLTCSLGNSKPDTSGDFTLTASGVCYTGNVTGVGANDLAVYYRYKASGGNYGSWVAMAVTKGEASYEAVATLTGLDYRTTYVFQCMAVDLVDTASTDEKAFKTIPVFDWGENDFNFNVPVSAPSLSLAGSKVMDFVVDEGTSDIWTYRKWDSGIAECWATFVLTTPITTPLGAMFVGDDKMARIDYPLAFTTKPTEVVTMQSSESGAWLFTESVGNSTNDSSATAIYNVCSPTQRATAGTFCLSIHTIGRWK